MDELEYCQDALGWFLGQTPQYHVKAACDERNGAIESTSPERATHTKFYSIDHAIGASIENGELVNGPSPLRKVFERLLIAGRGDLATEIEKRFYAARESLNDWKIDCESLVSQWRFDNWPVYGLPENLYEVFGDPPVSVLSRLEDLRNEIRLLLRVLNIASSHVLKESDEEKPVDKLQDRQQAKPSQASVSIPSEFRSKPITKKLASKLLGQMQEDSGVRWLNSCIADGTISCEEHSRQRFVFDLRQFPVSVHEKLLPPKSR